MDTLRQRLARGETVRIAGVGRVLHHNLIQMLGISGHFHGLWFDLEHVGNAVESLEIGMIAARAVGLDSFVRMPPTDYAIVTRCFEAGASGVMAAQIRTVDEAETFVRWAKFAPRGQRGLNSGGFDARFGRIPPAEFTRRANAELMVLIQIETAEAVECCDRLAAIDGVDMLFVGPADLSQALGVTGEFMHPKCLAALDRVGAACRAAGKSWGVVPASPEHGRACVDRGCRMLSITSDTRLINFGIDAVAEKFRAFL